MKQREREREREGEKEVSKAGPLAQQADDIKSSSPHGNESYSSSSSLEIKSSLISRRG